MDPIDSKAGKVLSPKAFVHVVLRTSRDSFPKMVQFYKIFLGATASYENDGISFLTYDDEHHRIAIAAVPGVGKKAKGTCGLEHIAFSFATLEDLGLAYQQRKAHGIEPFWCVNHGPTTSMYYKDVDGNDIECQVDNLDKEAATAFMESKEFAENPYGVDYDPEEMIRRVKSGEDEAQIKKRPVIGPRALPDFLV